jgi:hypothetical protein
MIVSAAALLPCSLLNYRMFDRLHCASTLAARVAETFQKDKF